MMKFGFVTVVALAFILPSIEADCTNNEPAFEGVFYPQYNNSDFVADGFTNCDIAFFDFFNQGGVIYTNVGITATAFNSIQNFVCASGTPDISGGPGSLTFTSCEQRIDLNDCQKQTLNALNQAGVEDIPLGVTNTNCCEPPTFIRPEDDITAEIDNVEVTVNIDEVYGNDADLFIELCEELWACTKYAEQNAETQCKDQPGGGRGCEDYVIRSLCFNKAYNEADFQDEFGELEFFIVGLCYGASSDEFDLNDQSSFQSISSIEELRDRRDLSCQTANDTSARNNFSLGPADENVCRSILQCILDIIVEALLGFGDTDLPDIPLDDFFDNLAPDFCFGDSAALDALNATVCGEPSGSSTPYVIPQGNAPECTALPTCPASIEDQFKTFPPDYPPTGDFYESTAIKSITKGRGIPIIENGLTERTTADIVGLVLFIKGFVDSAVGVTEILKDTLPDDVLYVWKVIPWGIAATLQVAVDTILAQADLHDGLVDAAEVEATYENTRQLLDGSAAIYDEVVCRCVENLLRGHGCDSVDNDCDNSVDECDEDVIPPDIDIGQALCQCGAISPDGSENWFLSNTSALECLDGNVFATDDCQNVTLTISDPVGTCDSASIAINAFDDCGNQADEKIIDVLIDEEDPKVACWFGTPGQTFLELRETGQGQQENTDFTYSATDNCGFPLEVTVKVFSNEIEDFQSQEMALLFQNDPSNPNKPAGLFVAKTTCTTGSNGQCIEDPTLLDNRIYKVVVSAKDAAGRVSAPDAECNVVIVPQNGTLGDTSLSTQRFFLTSYTSVFPSSLPPTTTTSSSLPSTAATTSLGAVSQVQTNDAILGGLFDHSRRHLRVASISDEE